MRILQRGDTGSDVKQVQTALIRAGYDPGPVDGIFGSKTETAVKQFQRVLGAKQDGIVGPVTWRYLEPFWLEEDPDVLRRGSRGDLVEIAQAALENAGFDPGSTDGLFGTRTQAAVTAFQKAVNLPQTGVVDEATWFAIAPFIEWSKIILRRGDTGILVRLLQSALNTAGYPTGDPAGEYGRFTQAAVAQFQQANGLRADGIAGPRTFAKLLPYFSGEIITYTVVSGDRLSAIAKRYNTTVAEILRYNPQIKDPNKIYPGDVIYIPVGGMRPLTLDEEE